MSDHTGKIARWIEEVRPQCPDESVRSYHRRIASWIIAGLTEQGIPIDKLLSGEMMAVESDKLLRSYREEFIEPAEKAIAQLDYAGNPPVEPAGATHSEKRILTGPEALFNKCDRDGCHDVATHIGHMGLQYCDAHH